MTERTEYTNLNHITDQYGLTPHQVNVIAQTFAGTVLLTPAMAVNLTAILIAKGKENTHQWVRELEQNPK
jgi:hypothetical protein